MIQEWRSYGLKPGAARDYPSLMADEDLPFVTAHLPLLGYWLAETGTPNTIHHLWAYADWTEREAAREALSQDHDRMQGFVPRALARVEDQANRLLRLDRSSPAFDAALTERRTRHAACAPLFVGKCQGLLAGPLLPTPSTSWRRGRLFRGTLALWRCCRGAPIRFHRLRTRRRRIRCCAPSPSHFFEGIDIAPCAIRSAS